MTGDLTKTLPGTSWLKPVLLLLSSQILFWSFLYILESRTQPADYSLPAELPLYLSDADGSFDLSRDPLQIPYNNEPAYIFRDPDKSPRGMFIIEFNSGQLEEPAFFIGWDVAFEELVLNGRPVPVGAKNFRRTQMSGYSPGIYILPTELVRPGINELGVISTSPSTKFMSHYAIGEFSELQENYLWAQGVSYALPFASIGAGVFVLALCLLIPWVRDDAIRITAFGVVLIASLLRNLQFFGLEIVGEYPWVHVTHFMAVYLLLLGFPAIAMAWTNGTWRSLRVLAIVYAASVGLVVIGIPFFMGDRDLFGLGNLFFWGWQIETALTVLVALFVLYRLMSASVSATPVRLAEFVIILFCVTVIAVEHLDHRFRLDVPFIPGLPIKNYFTSIVSVVLPLGLCITVANESARARRVLIDVNETLAVTLADKEAEIRSQARERAVVDERRRIMRDMHDGLGAMLSGIVLQTRSRQLPYDKVPQAVQNGLDELRLIIDSLDSAGDTLAVALGAFRERAEGYLTAANIELIWDVDPGVSRYEFAANEVLQIYRILQEATTNIVRHSSARNASYSILTTGREGRSNIQIEVRDDGVGLGARETDGKGLKSMQERAAKIGAELEFGDASPGTIVKLIIKPPISS